MTASPISDLNPVFQAARCMLTLAAAGGNLLIREVVITNILNEDPLCVGVGRVCKILPI